MKNKRGAEIVNVYTPHWWIKWPLGIGAAIMLCFHLPALLWASQFPEFPKPLLFLFLPFYLWMAWYTFTFCYQTRLIVYESGIEIQRGSSRFFSNWGNMSHFGRAGFNTKYHGILLFERITPETNNFIDKLFYGGSRQFMEFGDIISFPKRWAGFFQGMAVDTEKLLETDFGRDIYQFAPHLFELEKEKAKHG